MRGKGFTLVELAVVLAIVALLLSTLLYTLSAQTESRNFEDTRRRLDQAREALLSYAIINGRLPCPARSAATTSPAVQPGYEVRNTTTGDCSGDSVTDYYGGASGGVTRGLLPARTLGIQQVDSDGFAVDAWGNRIRYAVARTLESGTCVGTSTTPHWTNATNLKANGMTCQPGDLIVCKSATGITSSACGGAANQIMSQDLVVAVVFSTGKNGSLGSAGIDEAANVNGDEVFVWHTPAPSTAANGEFDDQMIWITAGELYGRLVTAGVLP